VFLPADVSIGAVELAVETTPLVACELSVRPGARFVPVYPRLLAREPSGFPARKLLVSDAVTNPRPLPVLPPVDLRGPERRDAHTEYESCDQQDTREFFHVPSSSVNLRPLISEAISLS
jgi:hypothetical protein